MLPRLDAEEQLAAVQAAALGGGHLSKQDTMKALSRLEKRAFGTDKKAPVNPAMLAAMGIAVVEAGQASKVNDG